MPLNPATSETTTAFKSDLEDRHLIYDYAVQPCSSNNGREEKWRYEMWFYSASRIVYAIHGGPMAGRKNFQAATYQCIRPGELWQVNWLEETGTICSLVYDLPRGKITTLLGFSRGHWERSEEARGDKRNPGDLERWRGLARIGDQRERVLLSEQADIVEDFWGSGELEGIEEEWETM
ncbi:Calycin-like protein [Aspergillus pseudoustus]|uniref:Calycin-like protein n=1 Tax=Aspergillus pseudoustus TaxID=1810923 RepID=A0ABR4JXI5_9EURO